MLDTLEEEEDLKTTALSSKITYIFLRSLRKCISEGLNKMLIYLLMTGLTSICNVETICSLYAS